MLSALPAGAVPRALAGAARHRAASACLLVLWQAWEVCVLQRGLGWLGAQELRAGILPVLCAWAQAGCEVAPALLLAWCSPGLRKPLARHPLGAGTDLLRPAAVKLHYGWLSQLLDPSL